jgi:hypothetical protein
MGKRALALGGVVALGVVACVDLFHSTNFETLCGVDPDAAACASEGGPRDASTDAADTGPTDFCLTDSATARLRASHACAWLGACAAPFDQNAFGPCMIDALLAYDCTANPNQTVRAGPLHDLWDALWQAKSCAQVISAVNPSGVRCSGTGYACAGSPAPGALLECVDSVGGPESCLVEGRVCGSGGECVVAGSPSECNESSCDGTVFHDCEGTRDLGYDCRYFGEGTCSVYDGGPGCDPTFVSGGGASCAATHAVTCAGDTATACPAGGTVTVECQLLTGVSTCKAGTPSPEWNLAAQCQGRGTCSAGCDGDTLQGCGQGAAFSTSCSSEGLGPCHEVGLAASQKGYACEPPGTK